MATLPAAALRVPVGRDRGPIAARPLRWHLFALVAAVALPLVLLSLAQGVSSARAHRGAVETGLLNTARAVASSVHNLVEASATALRALGTSEAAERGDLPALYLAAARLLPEQRPWYSVWLVEPDGRQAFNLLAPYGQALPGLQGANYVRQAFRTGQPTVSGLEQGRITGQPYVAVAVPILRNGKVRFLLVAGLRPQALSALIAPSVGVPRDGFVNIVGQRHRILARSHDAERWIGQPMTPMYVDAITRAEAGVANALNLEGAASYIAFQRVPGTDWTVSVGVLAEAVERPLRQAIWTAGIAAALALALATVLASRFARRIAAPMAALAQAAARIGRGEAAVVERDGRIAEVRTLAEALQRAGEDNRERRRLAQRERDLAFQLEVSEDRQRRQIARDLHDDLAQTLSAAQIRLSPMCRHPDAALAGQAQQVWDLVDLANRSTRSLAQRLAPPALYELGLVPALDGLAEDLARAYDLHVQVHDDGQSKPLSPEAISVVYRSVRELLINVAKHAHTPSAEVRVRRRGDHLVIDVSDSGAGFAAGADGNPAGLGLPSVRERLGNMGGTFDLRSVPGRGTQATLHVPLTPTVTGQAGAGDAT